MGKGSLVSLWWRPGRSSRRPEPNTGQSNCIVGQVGASAQHEPAMRIWRRPHWYLTRGQRGGICPAPDPYLRHAASEQRINRGTCTVRRRDRWRRPLSIPLCIDIPATLWRVVWQYLSHCQHCRCQVHHAPPQSVGQVDRDQVRGGQLSSEGSKRAAGAVLMCEVSQTSGRLARGGVRSWEVSPVRV
jgi:hypothetical protein